MDLASDLVNLYDEDLSSNMESDRSKHVRFFRLVVMRNSQTVVVMTKYFFFSLSLVRIDILVLVLTNQYSSSYSCFLTKKYTFRMEI